MRRPFQLTMAPGLTDHHNNTNNNSNSHQNHNNQNGTHNSSHRHSVGPWSLKDRNDLSHTSYGSGRGKAVSTHILGVGIVFVGVLVLAVGLIMGLEFPRYVYQQNKDEQCVVHEGHRKYPQWVDGSEWTRLVRIFYWTLLNPQGFLYMAEKPRFAQRGPYVYKARESKYDVSFNGPQVSYRLRRRYVFDPDSTSSECPTCSQDDTLTILSPWYIRALSKSGGEELLALQSVALYTSGLLQQAIGVGDSAPWTMNNTLAAAMGDFRSSPSSSSLANSYPELATFAFGPWLYNQSTPQYVDNLQNTTFSSAEMRGLYSVLTNSSLLGGSFLRLNDAQLSTRCRLWARDICSGQRASLDLSLAACGVIYLIHTCGENVSSQARELLHQAFCWQGSGSDTCLDFTTAPETLAAAYTHALAGYFAFLSNHFFNVFLVHRQLRLVESRPQNQLALGFEAHAAASFLPTTFYSGLLLSEWGADGTEADPLWKVYTCLQHRDMDNNMKLIEYNSSWFSPVSLQYDTESRYSLSSHTDFGTSCGHLRTCTQCSSSSSALDFFIEALHRPASFHLAQRTSLWGVDVVRYEMSEGSLGNSSRLRVAQGLQNMTGVTGFPAWIGKPHVTTEPADHVSFGDSPSSASSEPSSIDIEPSFVSVEPVTGRIWERSIKLQMSVGITEESAQTLARNIRDPSLPFPVFWTERWQQIQSSEVNAYKHLVTRLMRVSCGGVIGFSIVAIIIVIIGIAVCLNPSKPNRVSPVAEETSNITSRH
ncbi:hypothetical protein EGW08_011049 [Elysia chlorotica]|uniref:Uncharacterized protein n=1 Tax=Elysia chlorotica TaxID=188477 RepID=A0A3S1A2R7_ELYCH|nr:hypothetical protein EGW08_011049 [Elysia chlorotica]